MVTGATLTGVRHDLDAHLPGPGGQDGDVLLDHPRLGGARDQGLAVDGLSRGGHGVGPFY